MILVVCLSNPDTLLHSITFTTKLQETPTSTMLQTKNTHDQLPFLIVHRLYVCRHIAKQKQNRYLIFIGRFVTRWIEEELPREMNTKCLILIGPTDTGRQLFILICFSCYSQKKKGKTTFAGSSPGLHTICVGVWNADNFNPYADYTIYENVRWDQFATDGYPDKKNASHSKWSGSG